MIFFNVLLHSAGYLFIQLLFVENGCKRSFVLLFRNLQFIIYFAFESFLTHIKVFIWHQIYLPLINPLIVNLLNVLSLVVFNHLLGDLVGLQLFLFILELFILCHLYFQFFLELVLEGAVHKGLHLRWPELLWFIA